MKPYELHLTDAFEVMATLEDGSVDCLLTDPPYGLTALAWDKAIDWQRFWLETTRVCKPNAVQVMFSAQPFTTEMSFFVLRDYHKKIFARAAAGLA